MTGGLFELAIIFVAAAALGVGARLLKQPLILAYLLTGVLVAALNLLHLAEGELLKTFSSLGVMLILFLIGLEII